jgi:hypothetical protein
MVLSSEMIEAIKLLVGKQKGKVLVVAPEAYGSKAEWPELVGMFRDHDVRAYYSTSLFADIPLLVFEHLHSRIV